jgi:hypothetical protein
MSAEIEREKMCRRKTRLGRERERERERAKRKES